MKQIQLAYRLPIETFTVLMMLYTNTKAMICSLCDDTDFVGVVCNLLFQ